MKTDNRSDAHLFLGLLAYWIVNTIRNKLKQTGETYFWTEIVRRLSTQKTVTTEATNALGEKVHVGLCSESNKSADDIYQRLKYKKMPFRKIKVGMFVPMHFVMSGFESAWRMEPFCQEKNIPFWCIKTEGDTLEL